MKTIINAVLILLTVSGCSTLDRSLKFGATSGTAVGVAAVYFGQTSSGGNPSLENIGIGASVGMAIGLISSYFIHSSIVEERADQVRETQIYFGDLPPSPFVIPNQNKKGGH